MPSKTFKTEDLRDLLWDDVGDDFHLEIVENELTDTSRWSTHHRLVFKDHSDQKFYLTYYSQGATESQDESPFEYDGEEKICVEVAPVETTVIVYKKV